MKTAETEIDGFILVGGASSRMGKEKACLSLARKTLVERAASALDGGGRKIYLVGGDPKNDLGLTALPDVYTSTRL